MSISRHGLRALAIAPIRLYQVGRTGRLSPCRFTPSCSQYAIEAIEQHGVPRGIAYAIRRVLRCHPLGGWGYDPVPN